MAEPGPETASLRTASAQPSTDRTALPGSALDTLVPTGEARACPGLPSSPAGYELLEELGRGGMGVVYKARQVRLNRVVALKMILSGEYACGEELARFQAEAEAVARLQHPGVVQIYEVGQHHRIPFMALEWCPGGSLDRRLGGKPVPPREAAELTRTLARTVQAAHDARIVHRDLKPANILLAADGTPKVADFGLAKDLDGNGRTRTGAVIGTPAYMAPEQAAGRSRSVGPGTDVYALGVILYELLTGHPPFRADSGLELIQQVLTADPPVPTGVGDLEAVLLMCLQKRPGDRYPSAAALADDLDRFLAGEPVTAKRQSWVGAAARRVVKHARALAGGLLAVAAGVATVVGASGRPAPDPYTHLREREVQREVLSIRRQPPTHLAASPLPVTGVEEVPAVDNSPFEILDDSRVWDLRGWRPIPPGGGDQAAPVSMHTRMRLRKVRPVDRFRLNGQTSGRDVFMECLSHPGSYRVLGQRRGALVGKQAMKVRQCEVDVSAIPGDAEFDLRFRSTYLTPFQSDEDCWAGVVGYDEAFKVSQLVIFPEGRPCKGYGLMVAPVGQGDPVPFAGRRIVLADPGGAFVFWEVLEPEPGRVYRLHWRW